MHGKTREMIVRCIYIPPRRTPAVPVPLITSAHIARCFVISGVCFAHSLLFAADLTQPRDSLRLRRVSLRPRSL